MTHTSLTLEGIRDQVLCLGTLRVARETLSHVAVSKDLGLDSLDRVKTIAAVEYGLSLKFQISERS